MSPNTEMASAGEARRAAELDLETLRRAAERGSQIVDGVDQRLRVAADLHRHDHQRSPCRPGELGGARRLGDGRQVGAQLVDRRRNGGLVGRRQTGLPSEDDDGRNLPHPTVERSDSSSASSDSVPRQEGRRLVRLGALELGTEGRAARDDRQPDQGDDPLAGTGSGELEQVRHGDSG
jgi:hypothetical protein